jgi:hypothetical protein
MAIVAEVVVKLVAGVGLLVPAVDVVITPQCAGRNRPERGAEYLAGADVRAFGENMR